MSRGLGHVYKRQVEEDERYIEKAYRTLSEDNRKKLEVYAAALRRTQLAHEGTD